MSFRINDMTFRLALYSRFRVVVVEVGSSHGRPARTPRVKVARDLSRRPSGPLRYNVPASDFVV